MQKAGGPFDADHPPAAATAVIPAILPLPMPAQLFPVYMAWGAKYAGLYMEKPQVWGTALCVVSTVLMSCRQVAPAPYSIGLWGMTLGVLLLGMHHFVVALATPTTENQ